MDWRAKLARMLHLSPRKIAGFFLLCFLALIGVRHAFHSWQLIDSEAQNGFSAEANFDELFPLLKWIERTDYDLHLRAHAHGKPNGNVAIVEINERSIQRIGQFPFARSVYGRLIKNLEKAGAKVVALDMFFSEPERNEALGELKKLRGEIGSANVNLFQKIEARIRFLDSDQGFAQVIQANKIPVLIGFGFAEKTGAEESANVTEKKKRALQNHAIRSSQVNRGNFGFSMLNQVPIVPHADILQSMAKNTLGHIVPDADNDSVIRQVPVVVEYEGGYYGSLAVQAVAKFLRTSFTLVREDGALSVRDESEQVVIPLSRSRMLARYYGGAREFHYEEFVDVLEAKPEALQNLQGKLIFVGATAEGLKDIRSTPFSKDYPGVEVHATIASNILNGEYMVRDARYFYVGYMLLIGFGLLMAWVVYRRHPMVSFLAAVAGIGIMQLLAQRLYFDRGIVVPTLIPSLELVCIAFSGILYRYFTEEKEKNFVRTAFSRYVSGAVVEELLKDQSKLQLGGQKKELTVMFSDLAGFTKLSEKMDASFVTLLLNEYFTRMTHIILKNQGTLDKYMGDGIMCFWGAPLDLPDHATLACRAAFEMTIELQQMNAEWKLKHGITVGMRVGVHTGDMAVGNMGSEKVFSYTVMGDNVNLCSRLEGVNTVYGTQVIVSGETAVRANESFLFRALDTVQVKGKEESVKIFELIAPKTQIDAARDEWLHAFSQGLQAYQAGQWDDAIAAFGAVLALRPQDAAAQVFIERIGELRKAARPSEWDGVWKLHSK